MTIMANQAYQLIHFFLANNEKYTACHKNNNLVR